MLWDIVDQHFNCPYKCDYCFVCYNLDLNIKYVIKNLNYQNNNKSGLL